MRAVVQRVRSACVTVDGRAMGEIGAGLLVLLGVTHADTAEQVTFLANKIAGLRVFEDGSGRMNLSVGDVAGAVLIVPQFTLYGDCRKGRRPSFDAAARPEQAGVLCEALVAEIRRLNLPVASGIFRTHMQVELVNDGPVTIILDTAR